MGIETNCGTEFCITLCDDSGEIDGHRGDLLNPTDLEILAKKLKIAVVLDCHVVFEID